MTEDHTNTWRPPSATEVVLSDKGLARLGMFAALEASAKFDLLCTYKALARLNYAGFCKAEAMQFDQLLEKSEKLAGPLDHELARRLAIVRAKKIVMTYRHQALHNIWSRGADEGAVVSYDVRRSQLLNFEDQLARIKELADYTFNTKACLTRSAELILDRLLPGGILGEGGPHIRWRGELVQL